ncbi:TetR/AcrR family transcriptional regulator [Nocardia transvalensis]|uniref:TetR/AcrR family transcriptional regulator n=1 Tax=Nocardia transvalensis TaxID=37333 RepID=UPI0018944C17|nr:TetR/AcrR family transcriptional regulator [Nocardia transvalensis]MBF6327254.1 TetR/AcrR family transcriptional regulator [Nocardia transvalensis]
MKPTSPRYHHGDLRAAVLERAEATLRESGVDGLSLRQLARDLGVSHAAPSRHFRDKQALLDALALTGFARLATVFAEVPAECPVADRMLGLARAYVRFAVDNPALLALMFARKHSPSSGAEMAEAVSRAFATPFALISEAQARGEIVGGDPTRIGMSTVASLQGLATFVGSGFIETDTADEVLAEMITHLMNGLRPRS